MNNATSVDEYLDEVPEEARAALVKKLVKGRIRENEERFTG